MKNLLKLVFIIITPLSVLISCSKDNSNPTSRIIDTNLIKIEEALNYSNIDFVNLVTKTRGSVGINGSGSKVIWSKKNDYLFLLIMFMGLILGKH